MDSTALQLPSPHGPARESHPAATRHGPDPMGAPVGSSLGEYDYRHGASYAPPSPPARRRPMSEAFAG